ncbi:MAG: methylmalonyl-CoA mutase family protein [Xanthobacteraceae bacterium]
MRTRRVRAERDSAKHESLMEKLVAVAKDDRQKIMPVTIETVENGATMGEIVKALKRLWGKYRETPVF